MKKTGSLLKETLEFEAALEGRIAEAKAHAKKAVEEAEKEARLALEAAQTDAERYKEESVQRLSAETDSVREEWQRKTDDSSALMLRAFEENADELAARIAERILRYDA